MKTEKIVAVLAGTAVFLIYCVFQKNPLANAGHVVGMITISAGWGFITYLALKKKEGVIERKLFFIHLSLVSFAEGMKNKIRSLYRSE